jgi:IAA-amino acid hydrolase
MPHLTVDPIVAASGIVMALQTLVSRNMSPLESGVVSVTKIDGGDAFNVIPASVLMRGTIRALSTKTLVSLQTKVVHIITTSAATYGCNVTITWMPDFYPPTVNDPVLFDDFSKHVGALVSDEGVLRDIEPTMGGEDFSFIAETIPSTFFLLGQGSGQNPPTNYGLHHPHFALDESVMPKGVELHVNLALRALKKLALDGGAAPQVA